MRKINSKHQSATAASDVNVEHVASDVEHVVLSKLKDYLLKGGMTLTSLL